MVAKRKLIEVALPLEAINRESAREKSIRQGHPSTLHLWWARRPLAACRAVLFTQLVDDPSAHPEEFPTEADQETERKRLFNLIERLVVWENTTDQALLDEAHAEIVKSCDGNPPSILDPFAGGGSIPLEAQRLGLEAHASDLNPVAVLINKALIEIPPKWAGQPPVFPGAAGERLDWPGATGLAEDVRRYGQWMRDEAEKRIGHLYPKATLPDGTEANVIAWIWARTVTCPNPACGIQMPLVRSWWLCKKRGKEAWATANAVGGRVEFSIGGPGMTGAPTGANDGTISRTGAVCVSCSTAVPLSYIRGEAQAAGLGVQLMAVAAEGSRQRMYLAPTRAQENAALVNRPSTAPDQAVTTPSHDVDRLPMYGMPLWSDAFTARQLTMLCCLSDLAQDAQARCTSDFKRARSREVDAQSYGCAVGLYLAFVLSNIADDSSSLVSWRSSHGTGATRSTFARQAISMVWDFAEANPFGGASGDLSTVLESMAKVLERLAKTGPGHVEQGDAASAIRPGAAISMDPPYYDNVGYADLSDFFYVWLRRSLGPCHQSETATLLTPKTQELVAAPHRFRGSRKLAAQHFETGLRQVFKQIRRLQTDLVPTTIFYAFKQAESDEAGTASTGWETMLDALIDAGLSVTATWPMRTERGGRMVEIGANALASSIVLVCRPRPESAEAINRRQLIRALHTELPLALKRLQQGSIAPVDMAQAAIGPGMAVFSRYSRVVEADGSDMTVRTALALINQVLDEVLAEQEGDFDSDTRFAVKWFSQFGWNEAPFGEADSLSRSTNTSVDRLVRGGIFRAVAGKARLLAPGELSAGWDPVTDEVVSDWEVVVRLGHALATEGAAEAARLMATAGTRVDLDTVKELAYLLFALCEKRGWAESALLFNGLGTSWSDVAAAAPSHTEPELQLGFEM